MSFLYLWSSSTVFFWTGEFLVSHFYFFDCFLALFLVVSLVRSLSHAWLFATPWTVAHQAPLSVGFSRQEYWSGLPFLSPGELPNPGIKPGSLALQADDLPTELWGKHRVLTDGDIQPQQTIEASQHQRWGVPCKRMRWYKERAKEPPSFLVSVVCMNRCSTELCEG